MNIIELSKYILHKYSQKSSDGITPMKLQKLLFYIKVWTLVSGNMLVAENFEHWDYGPVNREVYDYYKKNGSKALKADEYTALELSESEKELINFIVENYISFDAITLSAMTHQEDPWKKTSKNQVITDESIEEYYREQRFAKNFEDSLDLYDKSFYTLKNYSFELDMEEEDAEEIGTYVSYKEYKKQLEEVREDFDSLFNISVAI